MGKGKSVEEKQLILNAYQTFKKEKEAFLDNIKKGILLEKNVPMQFMNVRKRTATTLDVSLIRFHYL